MIQAGGGGTAPQDELDLDAAVVPLRYLGTALQRMEMEAGAGAHRRKVAQQCKHQLHIPLVCPEPRHPPLG